MNSCNKDWRRPSLACRRGILALVLAVPGAILGALVAVFTRWPPPACMSAAMAIFGLAGVLLEKKED